MTLLWYAAGKRSAPIHGFMPRLIPGSADECYGRMTIAILLEEPGSAEQER